MKLVQSHIFQDHAGAVYGLCAGTTSRSFFSASADKYVTEWSLDDFRQTGTAIRLESYGYVVFCDQTNTLLSIGTASGSYHLIDLNHKKELRHITFHTKGIYDLALDSEKGLLYMAGGDGVLSVWHYPSMELLRAIPLSSEKLRQLAIHPVEEMIGIACGDGKVRLLELINHNEVGCIDAHRDGATSLAWHPQKAVLLTGGKDAMLRAWNTKEDYREILAIAAHKYAIYTILFDSPQGVIYTGSRDGSIKVWNAVDLSPLQRLEARSGGHSHSVNKMILVENSLISAGDDRKIVVWNKV